MEKIYAAFIKISALLLRRKILLLVLGSLLFISITVCIGQFVLMDFPNSADEYVYKYQAETLLDGKFWNDSHPLQEFFEFYWILTRNGRNFAVYLPGWAAMMMIAMAAKIPLFLLNPLLGALSLLVLFLIGRRTYDERTALIAVAVTAFSGFFLFNAASYFRHISCLLFILLFVYFMLKFADEGRGRDSFLGGLFTGCAFLIHPYSTVLCLLPLFVYFICRRPSHYKKLLWAFLGGIPFLVFVLFYNYKVTGDMLLSPYLLVKEHQQVHFHLDSAIRTIQKLKLLVYWTPPALLLIYFTGLWNTFRKPSDNVISLFFLSFLAGMYVFSEPAGNQYGPRYYFEGFPFLVLFVTSRLFNEDRYIRKSRTGKMLFFLFLAGMVISIPVFAGHCVEEREVVLERTDLYRQVEKAGINDAIVFIKTDVGRKRPMPPRDLVRNGTDFSGSVLYALDRGKDNSRLAGFYPDKDNYSYSYDKENGKGILERYFPK